MKRESKENGMENMKRDHWERGYNEMECADMKYAKYGMDNEKELEESVDKLANYVRKNKMEY